MNEMLTRFRNIVQLASSNKEVEDDGSMATREVAASEGLRMEIESLALVSYFILWAGRSGREGLK